MFRRIISTITLAAFLFTNTCLAADCLSSSKLDDITQGTEFYKGRVLAQMGLSAWLKLMTNDIAGAVDTDTVKRAYKKALRGKRKEDPGFAKSLEATPYFGSVKAVEGIPGLFDIQVSAQQKVV